MDISPSKVVIAGDSAGGHLALSLLVDIQQQQQPGNQETASPVLTKPEGLVLISPWLSLHHTREPSINNDVLTAPLLHTTAKNFLGPNKATTPTSPLLEFLHPQPPTDWDAVLPSWTWVSAGTNEIMFTDIASWTHMLESEARLGKGRVGCRWGEGEVHVWQWSATIDEGAKTRFLKREGECNDFEGVVEVGRVVGDKVRAGMSRNT